MPRRAASLVNGRRMAFVKMACRREHKLFDVPVVGLDTIPVMRQTGSDGWRSPTLRKWRSWGRREAGPFPN